MYILLQLRRWKRRFEGYVPLIEVEVSRVALLHNFDTYRTRTGIAIAPVLKSNAYGHGLYEVASVMEYTDAPFLVVDSLYEAILLRRNGIRKHILVIGYTSPKNMARVRVRNVAFTITSLAQLRDLTSRTRRTLTIHLKIDTGMNRQGILPQELGDALSLIHESKRMHLEGICSHFACADESEHKSIVQQKEIWHTVLAQTKDLFPDLQYWHMSATAGAQYVEAGDSNVLRLGIGLYGIDPSAYMSDQLEPALSLYAPIAVIKQIQKGSHVGYGASFEAPRDMRIATLPLGYFEGVDWRISNKGAVIVKNTPCPIVGRVSMNITTIDVTSIVDVRVGDRVLVLGGTKEGASSIEEVAGMAQTIPYEILVHIPQHLRRIIV